MTTLVRGVHTTDDALAMVLPLFHQVKELHATGRVAPLEGLAELRVDQGRLYFESDKARDGQDEDRKVRKVEEATRAVSFDTFGRRVQTTDADQGDQEDEDLLVGAGDAPLERPQYVLGYRSWEHTLGHHDALTDIHVLGLLLASLACGLDFEAKSDVARFVAHRTNLFQLCPSLNPVVARNIVHLTELDRHRRAQDLVSVIRSLENYREQVVDLDVDLSATPGFRTTDLAGRREMVLSRLRERLFEISRRNRLLYFKPTLQTVNLTFASVPILLDPARIKPEQIFTWQPAVESMLANQSPIALNKYLRFEDAPYLPNVLDKLISEARRDTAEFGFSQLRLVIAFLRWHNLKEDVQERIDSPLLLVPVELTRKKGVRDSYVLRAVSREAEVNPVLRYHLKQLYGIDLPHAIDLAETTVQAFYGTLVQQVQASEPGVLISRLDRPQVELVYARARRRLDQYRRRIRIGGAGLQSFHDLDYSYSRDNYQPLGLRLFVTRVRPSPAPLHDIFRRDPVRQAHMATPSPPGKNEKEKTFVSVREGGDAGNPYAWDFDLCSLTLGNFNYRRMSLVRDFDSLLASGQTSLPFDATFSLAPRPAEVGAQEVALEQHFPVVSCDPTQLHALSAAQRGASYIIQGPPGTGKSQTITNLIADLLAHGKRVLFVCEKRAAIDVVYHRLQQRGLHDLVCLIHDSQADKRDFILDLKNTYERLLRDAGDTSGSEARRRATVQALGRAERPIAAFEEAMNDAPELAGLPLRALLVRLVELAGSRGGLEIDPGELPPYREWFESREVLERLDTAVREVRPDGVYAGHPLARLSPRVASLPRPRPETQAAVQGAGKAIAEVLRVAISHALDLSAETLASLAEKVRLAARVRGLADRGLLGLLDAGSAPAVRLRVVVQERAGLRKTLATAAEANAHWRVRLAAGDLQTALEQARGLGGSLFRFLRPEYWTLRRVLRECYDFARHAIAPSFLQVLERLREEYRAQAALDAAIGLQQAEFRTEQPLEQLAEGVEAVRGAVAAVGVEETRLRALLALEAPLIALVGQTSILFDEAEAWSLEQLGRELTVIEKALGRLPEWLPCLEEAARLPASLAALVRAERVTLAALEDAIARETCEELWRRSRGAARFDGRALAWHASELHRSYQEWLEANAEVVITRTQSTFRDHVARASQPSVRLSREEEELKRGYNAGRRELEHEFGKTMRYKSVRGLLAGPAGPVILDLKPVWLMSPLSVSDTLPIDTAAFDAVVFDEASQVPLEEAVPALFRAEQVIISGDQMQLPPTHFFRAARGGEDDLLLDDEDTGSTVEYALDSDSFLQHASRNLASTLLGWHYRSRSEALISFSNAAFYDGKLLTVPDRQRPSGLRNAIRVKAPDEGAAHLPFVVDRPVGFHFMESGRYENRRNHSEAAYIAELVRALLALPERPTLAVVAFSEAQQTNIEDALDRLAQGDAAFRARLEEEYEREDEGQFTGLLVRNLENIQGDERDVVIMSICYGPGPDGRVLMNFGPINQSGGEKRLNVAFSRAKHHMVVVSSLHYSDVRNVYNDGANALRSYLQYASAMSEGDLAGAAAVLKGLSGPRAADHVEGATGPIAGELRAALEREGLVVEGDVGQSHFRCDLAVRGPQDDGHRVAVFLEKRDTGRPSTMKVIEREALRPALLRQFGWAVVHVLVKDWLEDPAGVVGRIMERLAGEREPEAVEWETPEDIDEDVLDRAEPPAASLASPAAPVEPLPALSALGAGQARYFEMIGGSSRKFWHVTIDAAELVVAFGRIGTEGQVKRKTFATALLARAEAERLIREKLAKGYVEKDRE